MKKKIIARGVLGIPFGITIGYLITIISSLKWGQGYYAPCAPELVDMMGGEIQAVLLQTFLCAALGIVCAAGSVIWEVENWNIVKQTGLYFVLIWAAMMPIAYFLYWMEHSFIGFFAYFAIFVGIFILMWLSQYLVNRRHIRAINAKLK